MAKTKEEITTITTKNYYTVQKQELDSLEALKKHHDAFKKETRASLNDYKKTIKQLASDEQAALKEFTTLEAQLGEHHSERHQQVDINKTDSKKQLEKELSLHKKEFDKATKDLDKAIQKLEEDHAKAIKKLEDNRVAAIEKSNKNIIEIEEKGVKDEATFTQKLAELETKYNEKVAVLNKKETSKMEKLKESSTQKLASIEEMIAKEQEKHEKKLATKKALFEEELEEIDEKINFEKSEFETKYNSIKESVEKRVAVREKHLQRALNDNDKRSAKQHKKDIAKFHKEAEHDLVVLEKNFKNQAQTSATYKKKFVQDYYEDVAKLNEQFATYKEDKQQAIELVTIELEHDIKTTNLDHDKLRAKELNEYNESFAQVREKQETAKMQRQLAVEQERNNQTLLEIEHKQALATKAKELEEALETKAKERRVLVLQKQKDDDVSDNMYQEALVRLDAEAEVADLERNRDLLINQFNKNITVHNFQHKRHIGIKDEFSTYQQYIGPLFLNRVRDIKEYDDIEVENRMKLKLSFYDKMKADIDKDYDALKEKVEETHTEEASFLQQQIEDLAGAKTVALNDYVKTEETRLREMQSEFEGLTEFKDRKDRKHKEQLYNKESRNFQDEKARREAELHQQVGAYQALLVDVDHRREVALKDIKDAYDQSIQLIQTAIDRIKEHSSQELEGATHLVSTTDDIFQQFNLQVASRTQQQSDAHQAYLSAQVDQENKAIEDAKATFERNRDHLNNDMQSKLSELAEAKQNILTTYKSAVDQEEQTLEQFKQQIASDTSAINTTATDESNAQNSAFTTIKNNLSSELNARIGELKNTLQTQSNDFNQTLDTIQKTLDTETAAYDGKQRQIKKDGGERLKEVHRLIKTELQQQIDSI